MRSRRTHAESELDVSANKWICFQHYKVYSTPYTTEIHVNVNVILLGTEQPKSIHFKAIYFGLQDCLNCLLKRYNERVAACGALCESPPELWRRLP